MSDILDIPLAIEQAGGSPELARDLFTLLLNELPDYRDRLHQAFRDNDRQALWEHAHKLHGATVYCGVPALCDAVRQLEEAIKEQANHLGDNIEAVFKAIDDLVEQGAANLDQVWK
jgi:two-component system sensor histidine kinase BarA